MRDLQRTKAQLSREAIGRLYISMRHLFIRGSYKPLGVSGEAMIEALQALEPEIYGSINDPEKIELNGLFYVFQRLPEGIEECRYVKLISREGFETSNFPAIVPAKRRRNCYRIDEEQMFVEMTRGRSDIYDILTHLTFLYIEAEKIRKNSINHRGEKKREWLMLEEAVKKEAANADFDENVAYTYLSTILGRTYDETLAACKRFSNADKVNSIFYIIYWLGKLSMEEHFEKDDREITFSSSLRKNVGHHVYGELWAQHIKSFLQEKGLLTRPIHIISANLHSVMNSIYGAAVKGSKKKKQSLEEIALALNDNNTLNNKVKNYALKNGMYEVEDTSGTNIEVQIFDTAQLDLTTLPVDILYDKKYLQKKQPILLVMDYAFGEQAYETMDELLKPYDSKEEKIKLNIESISIMGKAGILEGGKGDLMIPTAHVFEGTADNYPFKNDFSIEEFEGNGIPVLGGPMITVLGTSLQNEDILRYFKLSSWQIVGLEMEGAHYQKAIQAASKIRNNISEDVVLRYAYYASDNPIKTGSTLASGSLGADGVKPTYLITQKILSHIFMGPK